MYFRPSIPQEDRTKTEKAIVNRKDGSIFYQADTDLNIDEDSTTDIVEKIKAINSGLRKSSVKQLNFNKPMKENSDAGLDRETLEKIIQIVASAKRKPNSMDILDSLYNNNPYSRDLKNSPNMIMPAQMIPVIPYPYIMNVPVLPMSVNDFYESNSIAMNNIKSMVPNDAFQTRQQQPSFPGFPSFPQFSFGNFQFGQRPFASLFPVLIKNPIVALSQGGGWENFIEYGQSADVCNRKEKSLDTNIPHKDNEEDIENKLNNNSQVKPVVTSKSRVARAAKKRTVDNEAPEQNVENNTDVKIGKKLYSEKPKSIRKSTRKPAIVEVSNDTKNTDPEGDLRFPFGGFSWLHKKPDIPSPGFLINKLKVRRGGVAIAGPGGIATAGRGGTAIVGPGGLAYTKPGGLAIAGPHARVVALPSYTDLNSFVQRLPQPSEYYLQRSLPIREGKVVATGPVIYYHPTKETPSPSQT